MLKIFLLSILNLFNTVYCCDQDYISKNAQKVRGYVLQSSTVPSIHQAQADLGIPYHQVRLGAIEAQMAIHREANANLDVPYSNCYGAINAAGFGDDAKKLNAFRNKAVHDWSPNPNGYNEGSRSCTCCLIQ